MFESFQKTWHFKAKMPCYSRMPTIGFLQLHPRKGKTISQLVTTHWTCWYIYYTRSVTTWFPCEYCQNLCLAIPSSSSQLAIEVTLRYFSSGMSTWSPSFVIMPHQKEHQESSANQMVIISVIGKQGTKTIVTYTSVTTPLSLLTAYPMIYFYSPQRKCQKKWYHFILHQTTW